MSDVMARCQSYDPTVLGDWQHLQSGGGDHLFCSRQQNTQSSQTGAALSYTHVCMYILCVSFMLCQRLVCVSVCAFTHVHYYFITESLPECCHHNKLFRCWDSECYNSANQSSYNPVMQLPNIRITASGLSSLLMFKTVNRRTKSLSATYCQVFHPSQDALLDSLHCFALWK